MQKLREVTSGAFFLNFQESLAKLLIGSEKLRMDINGITILFTVRRCASTVYAVDVCVSDARRYCIKTTKLRITEITSYDSPRTLFF